MVEHGRFGRNEVSGTRGPSTDKNPPTMDRHIALTLVLLGSMQLTAATEQKELLVHFEKDSANLDAEARAELDVFLSTLPISGDYHFTVEGHTDSDGSLAFNDDLAASRATTVRSYLVRHGADPALVDIGYRGERKPIASNANEVGMALNRRVHITYIRYSFASTEELRQALSEGSTQTFVIDPDRDQVVYGAAGVQVAVRAGSFVEDHGNTPETSVKLELTEALGLQAMLANRLSTQSGDRLLETGGMIKLEATDSLGNLLRVDPSRPITVSIPTMAQQPRMQLFLSTNGSNWTTTSAATFATPMKWQGKPKPTEPDVHYKQPTYKEDYTGKPLKPVLLVMPTAPEVPQAEDFAKDDPWWAFLKPEQAQARREKAYAQAMKHYRSRRARYDTRVERVQRENAAYPAALEKYKLEKDIWDEKKGEEALEWKTQTYPAALRRIDSLSAPLWAKYYTALAVWQQEENTRIQRYAQWVDSTGSADMNGTTNYVITTTQLGWINCDRFYEVPDDRKAPVIAQDDNDGNEEVYLVFTDIRMLLNMQHSGTGEYSSQPVPKDEPAVIFAYTVVDGRAQVCIEPVTSGEKPVLKFRASSLEELGCLLDDLCVTDI